MRQQYDEALAEFDHAIRLSYKNPLLRFKRAKTLMAMNKYQVRYSFFSFLFLLLFLFAHSWIFQDALEELEKTKDLAPKEASVYRMMAEVYKQTGDKQRALMVSLFFVSFPLFNIIFKCINGNLSIN